jgi:hypothetical protein
VIGRANQTEAEMKKMTLSCILLLFHFLLLIGCATTSIKTEPGPNPRIVAEEFPEVELRTIKGESHLGKLIEFENETLELLPYPYWSVDSIGIGLDEIESIKLRTKKSHAGGAFASGFGISFIVIGLIAGGASKYDEDYEAALLGSAAGAATIAGVAGLIGLIADASRRSNYKFQKMTYTEKIQSLRSIMGSEN